MSNLALLGGKPTIDTTPDEKLFGWPITTDEDEAAALHVIRNNLYSKTDITEKFQDEFAEYMGLDYALAFANGTQSLEAAMFGIGLGMGDEIICTTISVWVTRSSVRRRPIGHPSYPRRISVRFPYSAILTIIFRWIPTISSDALLPAPKR